MLKGKEVFSLLWVMKEMVRTSRGKGSSLIFRQHRKQDYNSGRLINQWQSGNRKDLKPGTVMMSGALEENRKLLPRLPFYYSVFPSNLLTSLFCSKKKKGKRAKGWDFPGLQAIKWSRADAPSTCPVVPTPQRFSGHITYSLIPYWLGSHHYPPCGKGQLLVYWVKQNLPLVQ